jgi:hypothetical protein
VSGSRPAGHFFAGFLPAFLPAARFFGAFFAGAAASSPSDVEGAGALLSMPYIDFASSAGGFVSAAVVVVVVLGGAALGSGSAAATAAFAGLLPYFGFRPPFAGFSSAAGAAAGSGATLAALAMLFGFVSDGCTSCGPPGANVPL